MADAASMPDLSHAEIILRLLLALGLCGLIGIERETRGHVAGMRTHILVGTGAALFTLVSAYGFAEFYPYLTGRGGGTVMDPTRIAAQIVTGVGFLGAGAIIRQGFTVRGLTTAATLWMVAAIGLAVGAGFYFGAVVTTILVLIALTVFRRFRPALLTTMASNIVFVEITLTAENKLGEVLTMLSEKGVELEGMDAESAEGKHAYRLELRVPAPRDTDKLEAAIDDLDGVESVTLQTARIFR